MSKYTHYDAMRDCDELDCIAEDAHVGAGEPYMSIGAISRRLAAYIIEASEQDAHGSFFTEEELLNLSAKLALMDAVVDVVETFRAADKYLAMVDARKLYGKNNLYLDLTPDGTPRGGGWYGWLQHAERELYSALDALTAYRKDGAL